MIIIRRSVLSIVSFLMFSTSAFAGAATTIAISSGNGQSALKGSALVNNLVVITKDANGLAVSGTQVDWVVTWGSGTTLSSASSVSANGLASVKATIGRGWANTIVATIHGTSVSAAFYESGLSVPTTISLSSGNTQTSTVNSTLPQSLVATVRDQVGAVMSGVQVDWKVTSGGCAPSIPSELTTSAGLAADNITLGKAAGVCRGTATVDGTTLSTAFAETGKPGAPTSIAISSGNEQSALEKAALPANLVAITKDAYGNVTTGTQVDWKVTSGTGALLSSATSLTTNGLATDKLTLGTAATNTVSATINGTSDSVTFTEIAIPLTTVVPQIAAEFVNSIGINTHFSYYGTPYVSDFSNLQTLAVDLGVKRFRDGVSPTDTCGRMTSFAEATGGTFDLIVDSGMSVGSGYTASEIEAYADCVGASYIDSLEGPNEKDGATSKYVALDVYEMGILDQAKNTYADLKTKNIVAPSLAGAETDPATLAASLPNADFQIGNGHYYFAQYNPGTTGWGGLFTITGRSYAWGSLGFDFALSKEISGSNPIYITETGSDSDVVGETLQANYDLRALMIEHSQAPAGSREYIYQFIDYTGNGGFGLVDINGNIKPAYTALKNFIADLADPTGGTGSGVSKAPVHFSLTGSTANVDYMMYRKSTGEIDVVVWIETSENPTVGGSTPAAQAVTVQVEGTIKNVSATAAPLVIVFP